MAERRSIWPLLVYGVFVAIAARRRQTEGTRSGESCETDCESRPAAQSTLDEASETRRESRPAAHLEPDKRPREQFENDQPISDQRRRAKEPGRGRRATAPWEIPWAGWKDIFWRVYASVNDNRLLAVAAGVVFYSLLAIFPAIAAFVSLYGLIADASTIDAHLSLAAGIFPAGAVDILHEQIARLTAKSDAKLSLGFITGTRCRPVERQRGNEGYHRRAQRRLRREGKAKLREAEPSFPSVYARRDPVAHNCPGRRGHRPDRLFRRRSFVYLQPC